jgi:hypothetical protein
LTAGYACLRMLPIEAISRRGTSGWRAFTTAFRVAKHRR